MVSDVYNYEAVRKQANDAFLTGPVLPFATLGIHQAYGYFDSKRVRTYPVTSLGEILAISG